MRPLGCGDRRAAVVAADSAVIPLAAPTGFSANGFEADGFAYEEEACAGSEPED